MAEPTFEARLNGRFDGMIRVADLALLRQRIESTSGWYRVQPGETFPEQTMDGMEVSQFLADRVAEILTEERGVWTTMVYLQTADDPQMIKIYHPRRAGCGCGTGQNILPWWVLSRIPPGPVASWQQPACSVTTTPGSKETTDERPWWKLF
jgi:hypothetical protein